MTAPTTMQWLRTAIDRVAVGSSRLALHSARRTVQRACTAFQRSRGWVGDSKNTADKLLRLALLLGAAALTRKIGTKTALWAYHRVESGAWWWLLWAAAITWAIAAYRAGHPDWKPKHAEPAGADPGDEQSETGEPEQAVEKAPAGPPLPTIADLRVALARVGTPHAHVAVLATHIGTTPERVREALDAQQIPVEPVRMQGRGTSTGVKGGPAAHPALAPRPDDVAVVAAGQPGNNNSNNGYVLVPDHINPVRTHVVWDTSDTNLVKD
ncbi:hypothetical protein DV517_62080 [Streptomyces sp. S816]|uniref:hypothetical protein n=1 Tax=Streptomyces sp. S816 TaxID=2283197 RepID=UPI00109D69FB|nr:hypothetical protein [Streptomyces sp. S816]TGZ14725.1 hypothetical protein DV517_62080 [Streptomyces sp. S816]